MEIIVRRFRQLLLSNGCDIAQISPELGTLYEHTKRFLRRKSASKTWPHLFTQQQQLGITNVIHIAELSIATHASNAETEQVYSFLWRVHSKDRQSFKNSSLEHILRFRCDFSESRYQHAITLFLNEHSNGDVRRQARCFEGHEYPAQ